MSNTINYRKKLIEVALPLDAINQASAREKSIRHGHPSTLHLWWARRPLAACRAVLFSSLVNDPEDDPMYSVDPEVAYRERTKLFEVIEDLVLWENSNNPEVINRARLEIARSIAANKVADGELEDDAQLVSSAPELPEEQAKYLPDPPPEYTPHDVRFKMPGLLPEQVNHFLAHYAPPVLDPFAGGGSIPLEAQRLGLRAYASDLNPVPVLINKALIEIPPRFAGQPPVNPEAQQGKLATKVYRGAEGLAEDVRYYGKWMRDEAEKRIGHLYPKVKVTQQMVDDGRPDLEPYVGQELTVIAWLWARTVKSPNPAFNNSQVPLVKSFMLSSKAKRSAWVEPCVEDGTISYQVKAGKPSHEQKKRAESGTKLGRGSTFRCLLSEVTIPQDYVKAEADANRVEMDLMAVALAGKRERLFVSASYLQPNEKNVDVEFDENDEMPETAIPEKALGFNVQLYGLKRHRDLFTDRQLKMLITYVQLLGELKDKLSAEFDDEYAKALSVYLAICISKIADASTSLVRWKASMQQAIATFGRPTLSMVWDFAESNPFNGVAGDLSTTIKTVARCLDELPACGLTNVRQQDAIDAAQTNGLAISTDPPYYDNIGYADLSDFFYVWLRLCLREDFPSLLSTLLTPKTAELIADSSRFDGDRDAASKFFESGLRQVFDNSSNSQNESVPLTLFYAFKQEEISRDGQSSSTGWETMLASLLNAGFQVTGTIPVRTELPNRMRSMGSNALASSIVLVCRPRANDASMVTRRDFANALRKELPEAIKHLQSGNVAPVDLAQASIGPGMAVFSRYSKVVNADGSPMSVREALQLINQVLDESLVEQESDFDAETRFALRWFEQYGMTEGPFGDAETLAKAMAVSVKGIEESGIAKTGAGKVRLYTREELPEDWSPQTDDRLTMWESAQHLIRRLESEGETRTAELLLDLLEFKGSEYIESARELSYRLYQTCERAKRADEARSYNGLVVAWPEVAKLARQMKNEGHKAEKQAEMF